jgi:hypothetical protein
MNLHFDALQREINYRSSKLNNKTRDILQLPIISEVLLLKRLTLQLPNSCMKRKLSDLSFIYVLLQFPSAMRLYAPQILEMPQPMHQTAEQNKQIVMAHLCDSIALVILLEVIK